MLSKLVNFEDKITLIMNTGVQFLDFGLTLELRKALPGEFIVQQSKRSLARLLYDERRDRHYHPAKPGTAVKSALSVPLDASARLLNEIWLPIPVLRLQPPRAFAEGPVTWARARLAALAPGEDHDDHSHRLTVALDTSVFEQTDSAKYLAPTYTDVQTGASFAFAHRADEIGWFTELPWLAGWLQEVFEDNAATRLQLPPEDIETEVQQLMHHAHYLNLLALIGTPARLPEIKLLSHTAADFNRPIPVDLVLDVGNSRTCGILIEEHPQERDGLRWRYELELRDLTCPHKVYVEPFESRVEFAQPGFGKDHWAYQSGRAGGFLWPTIARVGPEAVRLASRRRGTEGATGISSPKRYLWDDARFDTGWRFNSAFVRSEIEPRATAAPFSNLINELGEALFELPEEERMPVFVPYYSRSALMMFMLAEVLTQALCQINSAAQRLRMPNADFPRQLRSIILTVPPSMPKPEREIFASRVRQAMGLVWKAFGWHPEDDPIDDDAAAAWPPFPRIETRWDEATCGQVVYLFSEIQNNFAGRPEEFFAVAQRPRPEPVPDRLTVATVDVGGGTTDLVINDYSFDAGRGSNVYLVPTQRFRDGFKVAGDDILLEVIRALLIPPLLDALRQWQVPNPEALLSRLLGADPVDVQESALRQQLALQVLYPAALAILKAYERYNPVTGMEPRAMRLGELLEQADPPTEKVLKYVADGVRLESPASDTTFALLEVELSLDLNRLHGLFMEERLEIARTIRALCEIVYLYDCDVLLLTGRPSRLPGVQTLFRALLPLPPDRIIKLHEYRTGSWYPFNRQGRIHDPKTTAAVGAMLCVLGQGRLPNFFFRASAFKPYSTVRYIGLMDQNMIIKADDVFYADVDLDDPDYELPDVQFPMRGVMRLGYRQLGAERWGAAPLYMLDFADERARERLYQAGDVLEIRLEKVRGADTERFQIASVSVAGGRSIGKNAVRLKLNTLTSMGLNENSYWLDSGSIFRY